MGKTKGKIVNWKAYNQALVNRGSLTFWIDDEVTSSWYSNEHREGRGKNPYYSDLAIETGLMIKGIFKLSLRALEGFLNSIFGLMQVPLSSPDYSTFSIRAKSVDVDYHTSSGAPIAHIAIDSTGLKVYGDGEWKARKHGVSKRRTWRRLHIGVDTSTHEIVCAEMSLISIGDSEVLPTLLTPLKSKINRVSADGAYDTKDCHELLRKRKIQPAIPPRANAGYWEKHHPRNEAVKALKLGQIKQWKKNSDYHQRSLSETAMYRYKQLISPKLSLRDYNGQVGEALAGVKALNKVLGLGMPIRQEIA